MALTKVQKEGIETLINNNADNRVITGSGTANTLNGESNVNIDSSGRVLVGITSSRGNFANNTSGVDFQLQLEGTSSSAAGLSLVRNSNDANDGGIVIGKTRATSTGGNTVVQAGDDLGSITFAGADGTTLQFGAEVKAEVESGVGNDDMPAALVFSTNSGTTSTTERLRIDSSGTLQVKGDGGNNNKIYGYDGSALGWILGNNNSDDPEFTNFRNGNLKFKTNGTEQMRIASNGWIYINSQNASGNNGRVYINRATSSNSSLEVNQNTGGGTEMITFRCEGTQIGSITQSGASNTSYNTGSDYRLKENISLISDGITRLKQLKPSRFNWIADDTNTPQDGFIAHEVSSVIPEAVEGEKDAVFTEDTGVGNDTKGAIKIQKLDYSKFTPLLTAALQEAIAKIETLETKVAALEAA